MECDRILAPTDGSDPSARGLERAIDLAEDFGATVDALYVVDEGDRPGDWDIVVERQETAGEAALDDAESRGAAAGVDVEKHLRRGRPAEAILAFVDEHGINLIVMGTHGRSGFDRIRHAGSTTERVLREATIPVVAVPPGLR
ncbi:universal stress protein [Natronomonas sp. F2-12]|uniref:Universal stress protein n=1 Tax=Natronomonas aquatica TaxID=2841590 RepID=A0A9R1CTW1_9EURY|nr:universal stress protein [Natronomonas aquatica]MCQ4333887.1 universal stress protein [Natronomonas aquatica]